MAKDVDPCPFPSTLTLTERNQNMERKTIKLSRISLEDSIPCKKIVGYQQIDGNETAILTIPIYEMVDESNTFVISATFEALQDIISLINTSILHGE